MTGKALRLICSEIIAVFREYNISTHCNSKNKEMHETVLVLWEKKTWLLLKEGLSHKRMSSENYPMTVALH
jgi:hypothetical protein